ATPALGFLDVAGIIQTVESQNDNASLPSHTDRGRPLLHDSLNLALTDVDSVTLSSGTYLFDSITISGTARLRASGPVRLVVRSGIVLSGTAQMSGQGPRDVLVVGRGPVELKGHASVDGILHFAESPYQISGSVRVFGSIVGREVACSGKVTFSPALPDGLSALGASYAAGGDVDGTFRLGDVYAYPNPARGGTRPRLYVETGLADSVKAEIFDVTGRKIGEFGADGLPGIVSDEGGDRFAYDLPYPDSLSSGVYFFVVTTQKSGDKPLRKSGSFSVVR
ncbi:MAG: T9SS type A sorting domain-containing protein, partial [Elusimicrobia bacterium]|nr:T9SS type A sorting domain-containing protein [Candidatus Obscuribacterium magneticum]